MLPASEVCKNRFLHALAASSNTTVAGSHVGNGGGFQWAQTIVERLFPVFGRLRVSEITRPVLRAYREKTEADGLQFPTVNRELTVLRSALRRGLAEGMDYMLPKFPMQSEKNRARQYFIEPHQCHRLWDEMPWTLRPTLLIGLHCGARIEARRSRNADS